VVKESLCEDDDEDDQDDEDIDEGEDYCEEDEGGVIIGEAQFASGRNTLQPLHSSGLLNNNHSVTLNSENIANNTTNGSSVPVLYEEMI
jgi:hypothetical protein